MPRAYRDVIEVVELDLNRPVTPQVDIALNRRGTIPSSGSESPIHIEDRVLARLTVVITTKLRRGESRTLSGVHPGDQSPERGSIWLHPALSPRFVSEESEGSEPDRRILADLADAANSAGGIRLSAEGVGPRSCSPRP